MSKPHFICGKANMCLVTENENQSFLEQQHFKLSPPSPPTYKIIIPPSSTSLLSSTTPSTFQPQTLLIKIVSPYIPQTLPIRVLIQPLLVKLSSASASSSKLTSPKYSSQTSSLQISMQFGPLNTFTFFSIFAYFLKFSGRRILP